LKHIVLMMIIRATADNFAVVIRNRKYLRLLMVQEWVTNMETLTFFIKIYSSVLGKYLLMLDQVESVVPWTLPSICHRTSNNNKTWLITQKDGDTIIWSYGGAE
jgi:hypothetical protein